MVRRQVLVVEQQFLLLLLGFGDFLALLGNVLSHLLEVGVALLFLLLQGSNLLLCHLELAGEGVSVSQVGALHVQVSLCQCAEFP